ncbi:MAG: hypothetical protein JO202_06940 [Ktedonobacteraceae bacterium]|nr:hypothetical protein [Ktedonobacteraceae bacterium]
MAIMIPPERATTTEEDFDERHLLTALRRWQSRLAVQQVVRWTTRGLAVGLVLAGLILIVSRLTPWATVSYWASGAALVCFVLALGAALWYRPSIADTAHAVDTRLALYDRLGTAWELRQAASPLSLLQRRDALQQLGKHAPASTISLRPRRSTLLFFLFLVAAPALLILLPNPMTALVQQQAAFQARVAKQVAVVDRTRRDLVQQVTIPTVQRARVDAILRDLEAKLQQAKNTTEAQQAIAQAQAKLDQLRNPSASSRLQGRAAAAASLQSSNNANLRVVGQALSNGDAKSLAKALQGLASQVSKLSAAQRSQLAQQVEKAANQASQNPALSSALHQLAKSIADGSQSEVSDSINAVNAATAQDVAVQAQESAINQASQSLQQAANGLATATDNAQGQGRGQGQQGQGQGQGQNQGQGQQGQNQGRGQGQGQQGAGGTGSGGNNGAGNKSGKNEQVYVSGQIGIGSSTLSNNGSNGIVQPGNAVPYSEVIEQYSQMAHDAIDNSSISPDMKDLVQGYFDTLGGQ